MNSDDYVWEGLKLLARQKQEWNAVQSEQAKVALRERHNGELNELRREHDVQPQIRFEAPYEPREHRLAGYEPAPGSCLERSQSAPGAAIRDHMEKEGQI